jgi:hydroxyacylglutathione hydrolase
MPAAPTESIPCGNAVTRISSYGEARSRWAASLAAEGSTANVSQNGTDTLLVGDAGRPDLHAHGQHTVGEMARMLHRSLTDALLALPDDLVLYPAHYSGSVCGRGLSATPVSTLGYERRNNKALRFASEDDFVAALTTDIPPVPEQQAAIVAANRAGRPLATAR